MGSLYSFQYLVYMYIEENKLVQNRQILLLNYKISIEKYENTFFKN